MKNPKKPFLCKFSVSVCICHLPNTGDSMVQCCDCKEWLHLTSIGLEEDTNLPEQCAPFITMTFLVLIVKSMRCRLPIATIQAAKVVQLLAS